MSGPAEGQELPDLQPERGFNPYLPHRRLLDPEEVRELSKLDPRRPVRDAAFDWAKIFAAWTLVALLPEWRWLLIPLAIPIIGATRYAHQVLAHDGIHGRLHSNAKRNEWLTDAFLLAPTGAVSHLNGRNHIRHHQALATEADPDRFKYRTANKRTHGQLLSYLLGLTSIAPAVREIFLRHAVPTATGAARENGDGYTLRDLLLLVGWQLALLVGLTLAIGWWAYPLLWVVPVFWSFFTDMTRQFLEHAHPEPDEVADQHRLITHVSSPIERFFFAPHHMNFHTVHHLWPSIPYYNLPEADRRLRERNPPEALIWRGSFLGSLRRYWKGLPLAAEG